MIDPDARLNSHLEIAADSVRVFADEARWTCRSGISSSASSLYARLAVEERSYRVPECRCPLPSPPRGRRLRVSRRGSPPASPSQSASAEPNPMCSPDVVRAIHGESASARPMPSPAVDDDPSSVARTVSYRGVVDLTHTLSPDFPVFPFYHPVEIRRLATVGAATDTLSLDVAASSSDRPRCCSIARLPATTILLRRTRGGPT
jgi:hypothetical protein